MYPPAEALLGSMITMQTTVTVSPGLAAAELGGEAVVLDPNTGRYYGLNELGARIFELIRTPSAVSEVVRVLLQEYEVAADRLEADVLAFLSAMAERKLIEVADAASA